MRELAARKAMVGRGKGIVVLCDVVVRRRGEVGMGW